MDSKIFYVRADRSFFPITCSEEVELFKSSVEVTATYCEAGFLYSFTRVAAIPNKLFLLVERYSGGNFSWLNTKREGQIIAKFQKEFAGELKIPISTDEVGPGKATRTIPLPDGAKASTLRIPMWLRFGLSRATRTIRLR